MPPSQKDDIIRVRVESALKSAAEEMADERGEKLSVIVRDLLRQAIAEWQIDQKLATMTAPEQEEYLARIRGRLSPPVIYRRDIESRSDISLNEPGPDEKQD